MTAGLYLFEDYPLPGGFKRDWIQADHGSFGKK
jgi:hypothetical protein